MVPICGCTCTTSMIPSNSRVPDEYDIDSECNFISFAISPFES